MGSTPSRKITLIYPLVLYTPIKEADDFGPKIHILSIVYLRDKRIAVSYMNKTIVIYSIENERFEFKFGITLDSISNDLCEIDDNVIMYEAKLNDCKCLNIVKLQEESYETLNYIPLDTNSSIKICVLSNNRFATFGTGPIKIYSSKEPYNLIATINEENYCWINMLIELEKKEMLIISKFNDHNTIIVSLSSKQVICSFTDIQIQSYLFIDEEHLLLGGREFIWMMNIEQCKIDTVIQRKNEIGSFQSFLMMSDGMVLCGNSQNLVFLLNLKKKVLTLLLDLGTIHPYPITYLKMINKKQNQFLSCSSQGSIALWNYK